MSNLLCGKSYDLLNNKKLNLSMEDRIVLTGLTNSTIMPMDDEEKKKWPQEIVCKVYNEIDSKSQAKSCSLIMEKGMAGTSQWWRSRLTQKRLQLASGDAFLLRRRVVMILNSYIEWYIFDVCRYKALPPSLLMKAKLA